MPIDPLTAAAAISGVANSFGSIAGQSKSNRENRKEAARQRDWNERMWHMQNQYNHPQQQMARLSSAGLNPRLIYGSGASSAVGTAGDVKGYDRAESKNVMEGFNAFGQMYQFRNLKAQTDNLEAQEQVAQQDAVKKAAETVDISMNTRRKSFDLGLAKELAESQLDASIANARQVTANAMKSEIDADIALKTKDTKVKTIEQQFKRAVEGLKGDKLINVIRYYEGILNKEGIQKSDNIIFRWLTQKFNKKGFHGFMDEYLKPSNW